MTVSLQTLVSVGSLLGVVIAVYRIYKMKEATMRAEGAAAQQQTILSDELKAAKARIADLESRVHSTAVDYGAIKADMANVMKALDRIEKKLDGHIAGDSA